jgi:hypothetical protein
VGLVANGLGAEEMIGELSSFLDMSAHLLKLVGTEALLEHELLEHVCKDIEKRAKEKIGEYQGRAGPFEAWKPLAESTLSEKKALGYAPPDNPLLRTGEMRDSIEHKVVGHTGYVGSDSNTALFQELGTVSIPARSFLGGAAFELEPKIRRQIGASFHAFLSGGGRKIDIE